MARPRPIPETNPGSEKLIFFVKHICLFVRFISERSEMIRRRNFSMNDDKRSEILKLIFLSEARGSGEVVRVRYFQNDLVLILR